MMNKAYSTPVRFFLPHESYRLGFSRVAGSLGIDWGSPGSEVVSIVAQWTPYCSPWAPLQ